MKISEYFNLNKSQYELDFVDVDIEKDIPLFLDPYFISNTKNPFTELAYITIKSYFDYLLLLLQRNKISEAEEIFSYLGEANEICLGLSKGIPSGKGMGPKDAEKIFQSLVKSKAFETGLMEDIEDFRIFVPNVDKDKTSDMTANIIKWQLIEYTQQQSKLWNIPLIENVPSGYFWDSKEKHWDNKYTEMLIVNDKKVVLVPKIIVSFSKHYTSNQYWQYFVLNFLQNEHLRLNSHLVKKRKDKTEYVTKKSITDYEKSYASVDKDRLADFTNNHPEVFKDFKNNTINKINYIKNKDIYKVNEDKINSNINEVIEYLIEKLKTIPKGPVHASEYHNIIFGIIELIFYPHLCNPQIEKEIHDGRKRIDITLDNCANNGFFYTLSNDMHCRFIMIECKNYSKDISNPELDQLSGRFSDKRGKFGLSTCRDIEDMDLFLSRCADTFKDDRGLIIPLTDEDFIDMLENYKKGKTLRWEKILMERYNKIALS